MSISETIRAVDAPGDVLQLKLRAEGYAFVPAEEAKRLLDFARMSDWTEFASSWNHLPLDEHMADLGRYRRRRHAVFRATRGTISRCPHQPHFQSLNYNHLNGGVERWFEPIADRASAGPSMQAILSTCLQQFGRLAPDVTDWHVEAHQFRIEAADGKTGQPTPEGMHRDGVDYVLVLLVTRVNIDSGTTLIGTAADGFFSSFTLTQPFDAAFVDDHRVFHGVTPVDALEPGKAAYRDVLVVTFRRR